MRKAWSLIAEDLAGYATGRSVVGISDLDKDPWAYPTEWSRTLKRAEFYFGPFDEAGTPLWSMGGALHYNPSRIAGYALALWNVRDDWGDSARRSSFMACADWFLAQPSARFEYRFDAAGLNAPWLSCIAQGQGISVLVRAHMITGQSRYLDQAVAAIDPLLERVAEGGLLDDLPDGSPFFEEYPGSAYRHVLNGCLHALVGLDELDRVRPLAAEAKAVSDQVLGAVAANLPHWDMDGWSTYDFAPRERRANLNTVNYQIVHVALMDYLARRSGDARLAFVAERWRENLNNLARRLRALQRKIAYRFAEAW